MKMVRPLLLGMGLALAAAALFTSSPSFARPSGAAVSVKVSYNDLGVVDCHAFDLSTLSVFEARTAAYEGWNDMVIEKRVKQSYAPAPNVKAVKPTAVSGWRSGRLRKLSDG